MTQKEILDRVQYHCDLRGLSKWTTQGYYGDAKRFQEFYGKPADELGIVHVQGYLHHQFKVKNRTSGTVNRINSGLRFLYNVALNQPLNLHEIPCQRNRRSFPDILTREEVLALIEACDNLRDKTMLVTAYGAGLRVGEIVRLRISDIDSVNMQIFIRNGKGGKDRFALLSPANLDILREYWLKYRPEDYLFMSRNHRPMSIRSLQDAFNKAKRLAGIEKNVTMHTLRHCFATHLLEDGISIYHIKQLLGHTNISTTCFYLHLVKIRDLDVTSPLDRLYPGDSDA